MAVSKDNLIQESRYYVQVFILIGYGGGDRCLDVLLNKGNRSRDGGQLYKRLKPEQSRICWFNNQHQVLCQPSGIANHKYFDLTFFTRIIEVIFKIKYGLLVNNMRNLRSQECHRSNKEVPNTDFDNLWKLTAMLENCIFDLSLVDDLKDGDPFFGSIFSGYCHLHSS